MENTEVSPDPAQHRTPEAEAPPRAEDQQLEQPPVLPPPEKAKFKVAAAGSAGNAAEVRDTDYYYG